MMQKLRKQMYVIFIFTLLFNASFLEAQWDPTLIEDVETTTILEEPKFKKLKKTVSDFLSDSWCKPGKVNLMMDLIALTRPDVCVEIGAFMGSSVLPVATTLKYLDHGYIYAIDAWSNYEAVKNIPISDPNFLPWSEFQMPIAKGKFLDMIVKWSLSKYCLIIQATSEQAIKQINWIDFLHLDGNFSEAGSLLDTMLYLPKVKSGGYILLSNAFAVVNDNLTKMKTLWVLFDECELICEIENGNTALFRKL